MGKGHEGHTLTFNPEPDIVQTYRPWVCDHCQTPLSADIVASGVNKRQVLDLPPLRFVTTEHQVGRVLCRRCGETTTAAFPTGVTNPVQYGDTVKQLAVYLHTEQFIPYERTVRHWPICLTYRLRQVVCKTLSKVRPR